MVELMKAELLLRKVCALYDYESVRKSIDEALNKWGVGVDVVESMICLSDDGKLWDGTKVPVLTAQRREWVLKWLRHRPSHPNGVSTAENEAMPEDVPTGIMVPNCMEPPRLDDEAMPEDVPAEDEATDEPIKLRPEFTPSYMLPFLEVGVRCGYLTSNYAPKVERYKFYVFAKFIGYNAGIHNFRKLCGLQWFGSDKALKNPRKNSNHDREYKELNRVYKEITEGV